MEVRNVTVNHLQITQANQLANAAYSMTLMEKRLFLLVASMIRKDDKSFKCYRFPAKDVIHFLGLDNNKDGYKRLRELTKSLLSRVVDIDIGEDGDYIQFQWMSHARYVSDAKSDKGYAELELQPHSNMRPYLLELTQRFATIPFDRVARLPSFHSIRILEILWAKSHQGKIEKIYIALDDLKKMLSVENQYPNFFNFKKKVILKAQKDLKEKTPISFEYETKKQGKKVIGLWFMVTVNEVVQGQLEFELPHTLGVTELPPYAEKARTGDSSTPDTDTAVETLLEMLVDEFSLTLKNAKALVVQFDIEHIEGNLAIVRKNNVKGSISNLGGYTYRAITQDFRSKEAVKAQEKKQGKSKEKLQEQAYETYKETVLLSILDQFGGETALIEEFINEALEDLKESSPIIKKTFDKVTGNLSKKIKTTPSLRGFLNNYLLDNYAQEDVRTLEAWVKKHG